MPTFEFAESVPWFERNETNGTRNSLIIIFFFGRMLMSIRGWCCLVRIIRPIGTRFQDKFHLVILLIAMIAMTRRRALLLLSLLSCHVVLPHGTRCGRSESACRVRRAPQVAHGVSSGRRARTTGGRQDPPKDEHGPNTAHKNFVARHIQTQRTSRGIIIIVVVVVVVVIGMGRDGTKRMCGRTVIIRVV